MTLTSEPKATAEAIRKLERMLQTESGEPIVVFTKEEADALRRVAAREIAWMHIGRIAQSWKTILTYIGYFIGAYIAFKAGILEWIKDGIQ